MSGNFVLDELRNLEDCWNAPLLPRAVLPLRCMTRWAGIETGRYPAYRWHGLKRGESEFCLFQYTLEGAGALRVGRASEEIVREGQALLINIPADHEYRALEEVSWRFFFLILHGRETLRITHALEKQHGAVLSFPPDHPALGLAARITRRIIADDYGSSAENSRETYAFLMALLDQLGPSAHPNLQRVDPQLSAAMEYCEHHLHEPMGVAEMARAAGMSRSHFSRKFHENTGYAPVEYLRRERLAKARRLLQTTTLSAKEIAARCGFSSASYFGKVFREELGFTPSEMRGVSSNSGEQQNRSS